MVNAAKFEILLYSSQIRNHKTLQASTPYDPSQAPRLGCVTENYFLIS